MAILKNTTISDTGSLRLPSGTSAERPVTPVNGMMRYNSTLSRPELYINSWEKLVLGRIGDYAYKEAAISFNSQFRNNWNTGDSYGTSMDATTYGFGILINETGRYLCRGWQRMNGNNLYGALSLNGDRIALESRSDNLWGHDHNTYSGGWAQSSCLGYMEAGWIISFGPDANYGVNNTSGWNGGMFILRLQ
jgi:hypothetical protein